MNKQQEAKLKEKNKKDARIAIIICALILAVFAVVIIVVKVIPFFEKSNEADTTTNTYEIGSTVTFGAYEQDNDESNGAEDIQWKVLDVEDNKALLLSEDILDGRSYNEEVDYVTWETSSLREWINDDFYSEAFSTSEQGRIIKTTLNNDEDTPFLVGNTEDNVFILSADELFEYFNSASEIVSSPTTYAGLLRQVPSTTTYGYFWMRTAGCIEDYATGADGEATDIVFSETENSDSGSTYALYFANGLMYKGYGVTTVLGVRPAIWVTIE